MFKHTNQEGVIKPLYALDDNHIEGIINFLLNKFEEAKARLSSNENEFKSILYPGNELSKNDARKRIEHFEEVIAPYIYEAALRNVDTLDVLCDRLWKLLGRE